MKLIKGEHKDFKPGDTISIKPDSFYNILFIWPDGRAQVQLGKGGGSFAIETSKIEHRPTDENEREYWQKQGESTREFMIIKGYPIK